MRAVNAEQALDELYATPPDAFTKTRDALAKRLKTEGDEAASAKVKGARKPTQIAYVLNQLARRHPDDVAALVDVGRELARAQRKALRGGNAAGELREAIAHQREVISALTRKTASLMTDLEVNANGHLDEVAGALQAALVDPVVGAQLEEGRLEKVPAPAAGFPGASAMVAVPEPEKPRRPTLAKTKPAPKAKAKAGPSKAEERRAKQEAARREREAKLAEQRREAEARANELRAQAAEAERAAKELRAKADRLAAEARARAKEAAHAEAIAKRAVAAAKQAARHVPKSRAA